MHTQDLLYWLFNLLLVTEYYYYYFFFVYFKLFEYFKLYSQYGIYVMIYTRDEQTFLTKGKQIKNKNVRRAVSQLHVFIIFCKSHSVSTLTKNLIINIK